MIFVLVEQCRNSADPGGKVVRSLLQLSKRCPFHYLACWQVAWGKFGFGLGPLSLSHSFLSPSDMTDILLTGTFNKKTVQTHILQLFNGFLIFAKVTPGPSLNNFTWMCPIMPSTKIAQMVPLHWTKWLSELKIDKSLNDISWNTSPNLKQFHIDVSPNALYQNCTNHSTLINKMAAKAKNIFKWHLLLNHWSKHRNVPHYAPLPKFAQSLCSLNKMGTRAKNRNIFN